MWRATNVARRATMQTSVPVGTAMTMSCQLDQVYQAAAATTAGQTALDGVASMMVPHYLKQEAWSHRSVLDEHENSSKENSNRELGQEPGCIYMIEYWMWLNTIEYDESESKLTFL